ncbi:MAG: hypothetical protein HY719_03660 [Planctomycetes bacterium]|nr:hypothetical protein [Planctomycetota bacterium]
MGIPRWPRKSLLCLAAAGALASLCSCVTMSSFEEHAQVELEREGLPVPHEETVNPAVAGVLNGFFGIGSCHLAAESGNWHMALVAVFEVFTWPFSVPFAVPQAVIDANTINVQQSLLYYGYGPGVTARKSAQQKPRETWRASSAHSEEQAWRKAEEAWRKAEEAWRRAQEASRNGAKERTTPATGEEQKEMPPKETPPASPPATGAPVESAPAPAPAAPPVGLPASEGK